MRVSWTGRDVHGNSLCSFRFVVSPEMALRASVVVGLSMLAGTALAAIAADEITALPGWSTALPSKQYSGLMQLPGTQKMSHYWFVEAESNPTTAPVVLWLNGGPGQAMLSCASAVGVCCPAAPPSCIPPPPAVCRGVALLVGIRGV